MNNCVFRNVIVCLLFSSKFHPINIDFQIVKHWMVERVLIGEGCWQMLCWVLTIFWTYFVMLRNYVDYMWYCCQYLHLYLSLVMSRCLRESIAILNWVGPMLLFMEISRFICLCFSQSDKQMAFLFQWGYSVTRTFVSIRLNLVTSSFWSNN